MKWALLFCVATVTALPVSFAYAQKDDGDDIVILAVKPRSPDVKPIAAAVSATGHDIGKTPTAQTTSQVSQR
jgi:hypothetical protein